MKARSSPSRPERAAAWLARRLHVPPHVAVVLGSGMGELDLGDPDLEIPYRRIPGFPAPRVAGHPGRLSAIDRVLVLRGRVHFYEGHPMADVVFPVRALAALGVKTLILTNAAGGLSPRLRAGDLMAITDHLNLLGENPLRGGPHFVDMSDVYDTRLLRGLKRGVYAALPGPSYETPAEVRMLRRLGADAVGMSTVPEAVAARQAGLKVIGISLITNAAAGKGKPVSHAEVLRTAVAALGGMARLLRRILTDLEAADRP